MSREAWRMARAWVATLCVGYLGCQRADNFRGLQLVGAVQPSTTCDFLADNEAMTAGSYDPAYSGADSFQLGLLIQNNLGATVDLAPGWGTTTTAAEYHGLMLEAVEGCWFQGGIDGRPRLEASGEGGLVDCADYPNTSATFAASGFIASAGGQRVATMKLLDRTHLRALFGQTFSAVDVPSVGVAISQWVNENANVAGVSQQSENIMTYDYFPAEPGPPGLGRAAAWGANYPDEHEAQVIYQMRAVARTAGGRLLRSNWLTVPINVCPKCVLAKCGPLRQKYCARGPCPDGTQCLEAGTCANPTLLCTEAKIFSGSLPDPATPGMCLPAQSVPGTTPPLCAPVGCDR